MNRKLLNGLLVVAFAAGGVGTFTSCKDDNFKNDVIISEDLIQAIRNVSDPVFRANLEEWLNELTDNYSDHGFATYADAMAALNKMNETYDAIIAGNWAGAQEYVDALYAMLFEHEISGSDWYNFFFQVADRATSVEIAQTINPMFGSINLPIGLKTTVLASYQYDGEEMMFPMDASAHLGAYSPINLENAAATFTAVEKLAESVEVVDGAFSMFEGFGSMGSVYAAINPSSVDFTSDKYTVALVDAAGNPLEGVEIEVLENEDVLTFGSTRAENSVYKLNVDAAEGFENVLDLANAKDYLSDVKEAIHDKSLSNFAALGGIIYDKLNGRYPAYGVQVSWEEMNVDPTTGEATETITNSVTSSLDIAAAVVKPLSYGTDLAAAWNSTGWGDKRLPMFDSFSEYLERVANKLEFKLEVNGEMKEMTVEVTYDGNTLTVKDLETGDEYTMDVTTEADKALATAIYALYGYNQELQGQIDDIMAAINDFNAQVGDFKQTIMDIANSKKANYLNKLVEYYNQVAEKVNNVLSNPNHYLQVAMIYSDPKGHYHHLSTNPNMPTTVDLSQGGDAIELLAASYTGDVLVPSYLKYVAVTTADADMNEEAGLNKVFGGMEHRVPVKVDGFAGKGTQTITYLSVDYRGVVSAQNYYINVVK